MLNKADIALQRLAAQRLSQPAFQTPAEVVAWLGAVQAQDYPGGKWALGLRMQNATDDAMEQAFNEGRILRTHTMRPTWHFVTPEDIRWMMALTAPRVWMKVAYRHRQLGLDAALLTRSTDVIARALQGGKQLTRAELGAALTQAGIDVTGQRLPHILSCAELDAVVCSGPLRGKQHTFALLDERAPQATTLSRDEALAELTRRYFIGHGPATVQDFSWWSGLTIADIKAGLQMAASALSHEVIDGQTYWFSASMPPISDLCPAAYLLPTYDEFLVGFVGFDKLRRGGQKTNAVGNFDWTMVIGGQVVGGWRRAIKKEAVVVELAPFAPLTGAQNEALGEAIQRYGSYMQMPVVVK